MNILVTGANGQLGNEMQVLARENHLYGALYYSMVSLIRFIPVLTLLFYPYHNSWPT